LNVSRYGALLASPVALKIGSPLHLNLHTQSPLPERAGSEQLKARVVHGCKLPSRSLAYGVHIEQALPPIRASDALAADVPIAWG